MSPLKTHSNETENPEYLSGKMEEVATTTPPHGFEYPSVTVYNIPHIIAFTAGCVLVVCFAIAVFFIIKYRRVLWKFLESMRARVIRPPSQETGSTTAAGKNVGDDAEDTV